MCLHATELVCSLDRSICFNRRHNLSFLTVCVAILYGFKFCVLRDFVFQSLGRQRYALCTVAWFWDMTNCGFYRIFHIKAQSRIVLCFTVVQFSCRFTIKRQSVVLGVPRNPVVFRYCLSSYHSVIFSSHGILLTLVVDVCWIVEYYRVSYHGIACVLHPVCCLLFTNWFHAHSGFF